MNRLSFDLRVRVLSALVEGNSIRGTARMCGVDKKTILWLLGDVGDACDVYQDQTIRGLRSERVQCDEIWSFCHAKERNCRSRSAAPRASAICRPGQPSTPIRS